MVVVSGVAGVVMTSYSVSGETVSRGGVAVIVLFVVLIWAPVEQEESVRATAKHFKCGK